MPRKAPAGARSVSGIVLVDKPGGLTSNRVLQRVKRLFQARKAGHTGTLDPMATGMLPVCLGAATRVSGLMLHASKKYRVTAEFGAGTDTGDATGQVTARVAAEWPGDAVFEAALASLRGRIQQRPPMYSAVRHEGRRLYELARRGLEVPRAARTVEVHELIVESVDWPLATLSVHCSKGTYVRTLVTDLAERLATVGHVVALRRLAVGPFDETGLVSCEALEAAAEQGLAVLDRCLLGADAALTDLPAVTVSGADALALTSGRRVRVSPDHACESVRIYDEDGGFVGLGRLEDSGELRPTRIFPA
jgi:tRNA pseudouridine55 synthase